MNIERQEQLKHIMIMCMMDKLGITKLDITNADIENAAKAHGGIGATVELKFTVDGIKEVVSMEILNPEG